MLREGGGEPAGSPSLAARPVLPQVVHLSKADSESLSSESLNPRTQTSFTVKATFPPQVFPQSFVDSYLTHDVSTLDCPSSKPDEMRRDTSLQWEDERAERYKDSSSGNWQLDVKGERKAEKCSVAVQNRLTISDSEPPRKDSV